MSQLLGLQLRARREPVAWSEGYSRGRIHACCSSHGSRQHLRTEGGTDIGEGTAGLYGEHRGLSTDVEDDFLEAHALDWFSV